MEYNSMVVGDLHFSDRYTGHHKDYWQNCIDCCDMITQSIIDNNITHLFLTGDIVGLHEKSLKRRDSLLYILMVLKKWNELTNGNVYSVRGNHDMDGKLVDFDMFTTLGYIKTADHVDVGQTRFHLIDYGDEKREIFIDEDKYNVAIMHNNIQVEGLTTWFRGGLGLELSELKNLYGVSLVVAGHIHDPSIKTVTTTIIDKEVSLFYVGNPTRPKKDNRWEQCFGLVIKDSSESSYTELIQHTFQLKPYAEVFQSTFEDMSDNDEDVEDDGAPKLDIEELSNILDELQRYNITGGFDYKSQVMRVAGLDKEASELALSYIEAVEVELNN